MGIDPALAGSVVLTKVTDVVGLFAFLGLATVIMLYPAKIAWEPLFAETERALAELVLVLPWTPVSPFLEH